MRPGTETCTIWPNWAGSHLFFNPVPGVSSVPECERQTMPTITLQELVGYPALPSKSPPRYATQEVIETHLKRAFLTSLIFNVPFIFSAFPQSCKLTVLAPKRDKRSVREELEVENSRRFKLLDLPFNATMHCKLWLLEYDNLLRVVISSANLNPIDWTGMTENLWFQDFPLTDKPEMQSTHGQGFYKYLTDFMMALRVVDPKKWLSRADFTNIPSNLFLVASIPGYFQKNKWGSRRLAHLLKVHAPHQRTVGLEVQASNIGKLDEQWLSQFYATFVTGQDNSEMLDRLKIIYPTRKQMEASQYNEHAWYFWYYHDHFREGLPCCYGDQFFWSPVDTPLGEDVLLHSKIYHGTLQKTDGESPVGQEVISCWTYAGSHNLTRSAWGEEQAGTLYLRNFELGVLFLHQSEEGLVTLPYSDTRPYGVDDLPWNKAKT